jgi:hypothetical protein
MRRWLPVLLVLGCAVPATAQSWGPPPEGSYIIGNTLVPGTPRLVAWGKRGGGAPAPAPAPSPASAPAPSFSGDLGRAESGFTFPPYRVQAEGQPVGGPIEMPPITVVPIPPGPAGGSPGCCAPYATLTIPVQLLQASPPPMVSATPLPAGRQQRACPTGCVPGVDPMPPPQAHPTARPHVCNTLGQCIPWP